MVQNQWTVKSATYGEEEENLLLHSLSSIRETSGKVLKLAGVTDPVTRSQWSSFNPVHHIKSFFISFAFWGSISCLHSPPSTTFRDESCPGGRTAPLWLMSLALECPLLMRLSLWRQVFLLPPTWFLLKNHPLQTLPFISFWMFETCSNTSFSYTFFCNKEEGSDIVFLSAVLLL